MKIALIGRGMGDRGSLTLAALDRMEEAEVLFGPKRMLEGLGDKRSYSFYLPADILPLLSKEKPERAAIIFSGDSGFFSGAGKMYAALKSWAIEQEFPVDLEILPGISSFSYLAAKLGLPYNEACLFSLHGKKEDPKALGQLKEAMTEKETSFVLLSGDSDVRCIARLMAEIEEEQKHLDAFTLILGSNLSYDDEKIVSLDCRTALTFDEAGLYVACVRNAFPVKRQLLSVKKDAEFLRDQVPMTKEVIRHESIVALQLKEEDVVYDIGSGTGSVAIEMAALSPTLSVFAFERKTDALELQKKNIEKFSIRNITLLEGDALDTLVNASNLPAPDAVFIGGSGGKLLELVKALPRKEKADGSLAPIRVVVNAVSLETIAELSRLEKELCPMDFEGKQIAVSNVRSLGDYHLMQAENPVLICSFSI